MFENLSVPAGPSSCAEATTAKEAAYRIDHPLPAARHTRVVAFDPAAQEIIRAAAELEWGEARFYSTNDPGDRLVTMVGETVALVDEIADSNTLIMVSVTGANAAAVAHIGEACYRRGIMTAGLAVTPEQLDSEALHRLRPHARVLLVPAEPDDLVELLQATRA
ncbi:MAG: 3-methyl-2-oxobutanoate hydroxymethyltransferase [Nocardioides sp.]|nr:3-methyl-2-oxobutanoate hydroxymethyltransferase [Nocardioides sp.]